MAAQPVRFTSNAYAPLEFSQIQGQPYQLPMRDYHEHLPKFVGNNAVTMDDQLDAFLQFVNDLKVQHEDVVLMMFVQTLLGDARAWYKVLPANAIDGWDSFQNTFTERQDNKQDNTLMLDAFASI